MADQQQHIQIPHAHSRQPIVAIDTSASDTTPALQATTGTQPIAIPGSNSLSIESSEPIISPTSPSKSVGKKTGTRSTFCPNTLRKGTKLTEEDFEHHEKKETPQPASWLQMLGLKKSANYGEAIDKSDEPHHQSYY
ncbi:hypothetical protein BGZ83_008938 [Gryganskiella cystojenkinii]|nr:hypothetical protein BGZ83_008938 [Gryganskiella cystojenkinii]